jgi:hypothetical protein
MVWYSVKKQHRDNFTIIKYMYSLKKNNLFSQNTKFETFAVLKTAGFLDIVHHPI